MKGFIGIVLIPGEVSNSKNYIGFLIQFRVFSPMDSQQLIKASLFDV